MPDPDHHQPAASDGAPLGQPQPIGLTLSPRLDSALTEGAAAWADAARAAGPAELTAWLAHRLRRPDLRAELQPTVEEFLQTDDVEERSLAIAELAELVEGSDDLLADALWEQLLALGEEHGDPDMIIEAITHLATIAEEHGDVLDAAEYFLHFLNWRRQPDHSSDPESVAVAFDEVIRLAESDGNPEAVALFEYRLAAFTRLAEADDERATTGEWEQNPAPYESWE